MTQGVVPVTVDYTINGNPYTEILNSTGITSVVIPNTNLSFGINTFSIVSIIDVNNEANLQISLMIFRLFITLIRMHDIYYYYSCNLLQRSTILEFDFLARNKFPFTVNYTINGTIQVPSLKF